MRLSRKIWVIAGFVVIGVVLGLVASAYFQSADQYRALEDRLAVAQTRVPTLTTEKEGLENDERQAESRLNTSLAKFPRSIEIIEYGEDLFALAAGSNVRIVRMTASAPGNTEVSGVTYSTSTVSMTVEGNVVEILEFIHALRTAGDFQLPWSAQVGGINIDYGSRRASIPFTIYAYKG